MIDSFELDTRKQIKAQIVEEDLDQAPSSLALLICSSSLITVNLKDMTMAWVVYCTLYKFSVFYDPSQYLHTSPESFGQTVAKGV